MRLPTLEWSPAAGPAISSPGIWLQAGRRDTERLPSLALSSCHLPINNLRPHSQWAIMMMGDTRGSKRTPVSATSRRLRSLPSPSKVPVPTSPERSRSPSSVQAHVSCPCSSHQPTWLQRNTSGRSSAHSRAGQAASQQQEQRPSLPDPVWRLLLLLLRSPPPAPTQHKPRGHPPSDSFCVLQCGFRLGSLTANEFLSPSDRPDCTPTTFSGED